MTRLLFAAIDAVGNAVAAIAAVLTVSIAVMILSEVAARSLFNISLSFAWEYSSYAMGIAMFCGAAFTLRTGGHIRVSLLASSVSPRAAYLIDIVCTVFAIGVSGYVTWALIAFAWRSFVAGSTSATISATPLAVPQGAIAFGATLLTLQLLMRLFRLLLGHTPDDESGEYQVE